MLTPLLKSAFGPGKSQLIDLFDETGGVGELALFLNGVIPWYCTYTRLGLAYTSAGTFAQDVPPYEIVDGEKRFVTYEGENLVTESQNFGSSDWIKHSGTVVTDNQAIAPDGELTADLIVGDGNNGILQPGKTVSTTIANSKSIWLRSVSGSETVELKDPNQTVGTIVCNLTEEWEIYTLSEIQSGGAAGIWVSDISASGVYAWQGQLTDTPYLLPTIPTTGTAVTVNKGTTSLLAEDIDDASYNFTNTGNETVNTGLLKQALTSVSFNIRLRTTNGDVITQCPKDTSDAIAAVTSGAGYAINFSHDGTDYVTDTELAFNTSYQIELTDAGVLSVNGTPDTLSAGSPIAFASTDILFGSRGADLHIDGYMWDVKYYDTTLLAWYKCAEYRQDVLSPDSSGLGNDGTIINATLVDFRVENQGFGYPVNELARLPWVSPLGTKYGVKGALNGVDGNQATFSIPFTKYIPHGTTEDLPFIQHTTNDFVPLYRGTDGLIKGTDGTNTCVSTAVATEGSTVSGWFSFNGPENEMWITLDGVKGAISTCLDALPDVGPRLFGLTSGTYQSNENLYFKNELL